MPSEAAMIVEKTSTLNVDMLAIYMYMTNSHQLFFNILTFKQTHFGYKYF